SRAETDVLALGTLLTLVVVLLAAEALARRGALRGDRFALASLLTIVLLVALFVFFPLGKVMGAALQGGSSALDRLTAEKIWPLGCLASTRSCGVAWNTLALALVTAVGTTGLGLVLALLVTRTALPLRRLARMLAVLPVITPPFVIGLAIILICG